MDLEEEIEPAEYVRPPNPLLEFRLTPEQKFKCRTLCIAFYAQLNFQRAKQRALGSVYCEANTIFLIFNENFEPMKEIHLSEFINRSFEFESVILLTSRARGLLEKPEGSNCQHIANSYWQDCPGARYQEGLTGPEAELIMEAELRRVPLICFVGVYEEYELSRQSIGDIFGCLEGKIGLSCKHDISGLIKKFNMTKYGNKIYL